MDLDREMELLMAGKIVDPRPKVFTKERDEDGNLTGYVVRLDTDMVFALVMWLLGIYTGVLMGKRG